MHQKRNRNPSHKGTKRGDVIDSKSPEGTRRLGPPFPIKSTQGFSNPSSKSILKRRTEGEEHRGGGLGKQRIHGHNTKAALNLTQVKGYLYPRDRSDRLVRPVRPVPGTGQTGWPAAPLYNDLIRRPRFFLRNEVFSAMPPS